MPQAVSGGLYPGCRADMGEDGSRFRWFPGPGARLNKLDARPRSGLLSSDLMSDENAPSPDPAKNPPTEGAPRVRRISNPRIKKPAKSAAAPAPVPEAAAVAEPQPEEMPMAAPAVPVSKFPVFHDEPERPEPVAQAADSDASDSGDAAESSEESPGRSDWPEPEAPSSGASSENNKRKRRRKKGKGGNSHNGGGNTVQAESDASSGPAAEGPDSPNSQPAAATQSHSPRPNHAQAQHGSQASRPRPDPDLLAKFAWKIYLSEVSEEGVALVGDNDAKELSRRCFRLAEIFLEEQARRR